ncbi:MAG: IS3 family transposase [Bacteroidales bacterium]|nr:IS3 family transposase [Paludibacteraceae bacterium]MDD3945203.1 IS3 family transposase [Bacteroidales bacterium]
MQTGIRAIGDTETLEKVIDPQARVSIRRQCELLGVNRSNVYYQPVPEDPEDLELMRLMDEEFLGHPNKGVLSMVDFIKTLGILVGPKRVRRLLRKMGIMAIYPQKNLSKLGIAKYIHPYVLRGLEITRSNQVWCIDLTYIPMKRGFLYLTAIIDVYSRYIVGWGLFNTLDAENTLGVLKEAITLFGNPEIINSDQGSQFTCSRWVEYLKNEDIIISMDGKGRASDNAYIERFWRTLKWEYVYLNPAEDGKELQIGIKEYLYYYNNQRTHQSLNHHTPYSWYENAA